MAQQTPEQRHRRQVRNQIILPMIVVILLIVLMAVLLVGLLNPNQLSLATDFMAIIFFLVPAVILCLIPALGLFAAALWVALSAGKAQPPLARGRLAALSNLDKVQQFVPRIAQPVLAAQAKLTYWERILGIRRTPAGAEEKQKHER